MIFENFQLRKRIFKRFLFQVIDNEIEKSHTSELRKRELLYKNWYLKVYEPIQSKIRNNMLSSNADYARDIRSLRYLEFLHQVNKLGGVYQDDYERNEYDPMNLLNMDSSLTHKLKDPTHISTRKFLEEDGMVLKWITGKDFTNKETENTKLPIIINESPTRADLDWNDWILDQYNSIESMVREKSS